MKSESHKKKTESFLQEGLIELMIKCRLCPVGSRPMKNKEQMHSRSFHDGRYVMKRESHKKKDGIFSPRRADRVDD